jgi:nucleoside-diphosphate-sugar epimerase
MTSRKALVTGSEGFIGRHLCKALVDHGWTVGGLDLKNGQDIRTCEFPDADMCFHLAARSDARSMLTIEDASHNIMGTIRVLEHYKERVVFASSYAIFYPNHSYAITKLAGHHYCQLYNARMVRMCNVTGPGGPGVIEKFRVAETLRIAGKGDQKRVYAPVSRAVAAFIQAADSPPGTVIVLDGVELSVMDIADLFHPTKPREFFERQEADVQQYTIKKGEPTP